MNHMILKTRLMVAGMIMLLPLAAMSAEAALVKKPAESATLSDDEVTAISERIRRTGEKMRADLKEARARLEAQKVQQAAQRKLDAEQARQQANKDAVALAKKSSKPAQPQETAGQVQAQAQAQARREADRAMEARLEAAYTELKVKEDKLLAKERAAKALADARKSPGARAFSDSGM